MPRSVLHERINCTNCNFRWDFTRRVTLGVLCEEITKTRTQYQKLVLKERKQESVLMWANLFLTTDQYDKSGALITLLAILCFSIISSSSSSYGKSDGYEHGCNDAGISDKASRYINQPEAGPSLHSDEFMHGYNDGFDACSSSNDNSNMEDDGWTGDTNQTRTDCISPIDGMSTC